MNIKLGISIDDLTARVLHHYDRNKDTKINLNSFPEENLNLERRDRTCAEKDTCYNAHDLSEKVAVRRKFSPLDLNPFVNEERLVIENDFLLKADTNKDNVTTKEEIKNFIKLFDDNDDGIINDDMNPLGTSELEKLKARFPEEKEVNTFPLKMKNKEDCFYPGQNYEDPKSHYHLHFDYEGGIYDFVTIYSGKENKSWEIKTQDEE
jgi:hypothetical protein